MSIIIKRIYEDVDNADGYRMLIDRFWPRGIKKEDAKLDEWNKDIAPSVELRKWFDHKEERFKEFSKKYKEELLENSTDEIERLRSIAKKKKLILLYGAKDPLINHAVVLLDVLQSK